LDLALTDVVIDAFVLGSAFGDQSPRTGHHVTLRAAFLPLRSERVDHLNAIEAVQRFIAHWTETVAQDDHQVSAAWPTGGKRCLLAHCKLSTFADPAVLSGQFLSERIRAVSQASPTDAQRLAAAAFSLAGRRLARPSSRIQISTSDDKVALLTKLANEAKLSTAQFADGFERGSHAATENRQFDPLGLSAAGKEGFRAVQNLAAGPEDHSIGGAGHRMLLANLEYTLPSSQRGWLLEGMKQSTWYTQSAPQHHSTLLDAFDLGLSGKYLDKEHCKPPLLRRPLLSLIQVPIVLASRFGLPRSATSIFTSRQATASHKTRCPEHSQMLSAVNYRRRWHCHRRPSNP
jgi:hypothetical protein